MDDKIPSVKWLSVAAMLLVILLTVFGNLLVILAVLTSRVLRQAQNFLIVSLACADMAVGMIVLPLQVKVYITNDAWLLPSLVCTIFTTSDIFFCTASILNLAAIAVDRFCAVKYPIAYASKRTTTTVSLMIAGIFTLSGFISIGPILSWRRTPMGGSAAGNATEPGQECKLPEEKGYVVFSALGSFYIPTLVILSLYISIFFAIKRRLKKRSQGTAAHKITQLQLSPAQDDSSDGRDGHHEMSQRPMAASDAPPCTQATSGEEATSRMISEHSRNRQKISLSHERRALRTLGIIMGIFMLCWLPFFVVYLGGVWGLTAHKAAFSFFVWLGYLNSALNPIIYTIFNLDFRRAFSRLMRLKRPR